MPRKKAARRSHTLESTNQGDIRNDPRICRSVNLYRCNVGTGWQGRKISRKGRIMTIEDPRPFTTGLPRGWPDLLGWRSVLVTPEMVGSRIAQVVAFECKSSAGHASEEQNLFLAALQADGGLCGIARTADEALAVLK